VSASSWATSVFGSYAEIAQNAVVSGIREAHDDSLAAQLSSRTRRQDPYGHTLKNRQYECLIDHLRAADIPGFDVFSPTGAVFDLVRFNDTHTVLFPWRFASDQRVRHDTARMVASRTSHTRRDLLTVTSALDDDQLSLDDAAVADEELQVQNEERRQVEAQLRGMARVITIGYASNVSGIFELGWGEASLDGHDGTVTWAPWHPLTQLLVATRPSSETVTPAPQTVPESSSASTLTRGPRFDDAPLVGGFDLLPRQPFTGEPGTANSDGTPERAGGDSQP
jgi:hypothetical protein